MAGLRPEQDAYGRAMLAHLEGSPSFEIVERDDGYFAPSSGSTFYFAGPEDWPRCEGEALELAHGRVLDVGAGAGRVSLHLQERGHEVVAIDNSPAAIDVCRRRGVRDARVVPFTEISPKLGVFDTIVCFGNNFGLFGRPRRARWLLRRLKRLTSPDAVILGESRDPYDTDNPDHLAYHRFSIGRGRWPGELRIRVRYKHLATPFFDYLMVSPDEMRSLCEDTGWRLERTIAHDDAPVYVGVLRKG